MKFAMGVTGAAIYCSLCELATLVRESISFTPSTYRSTFEEIVEYIDNLDEQQRGEMLTYFQHIISIGKSSARSVVEISPYDVD
jgi:hypothetical protein